MEMGLLTNLIEEGNNWDISISADDDLTGKNDADTGFRIYHASKILAHQASRDFVQREKPGFTLISLHPAFVYGHNPLQKTADEVKSGTNGMLWAGIMVEGAPNVLTWVNVEDVADAHVLALDPKHDTDQSYLIAGQPSAKWEDVLDIVKADYPHLPYKLKADPNRKVTFVDASKAEKDLGIKWRSLKQTVHEVVDQQLGFLTK